MKRFTVITAFILGLVTFAAGLYTILRDIHLGGVSHVTNAWLGGTLIFFGLALMLPLQVMATAKGVVSVIGPFLPVIKLGRRSTDGVMVVKEEDIKVSGDVINTKNDLVDR